MRLLNERTSMLLGALLAVGSLSAIAEPATDLQASILSKAAESDKGVIVVLTERGGVAVQAAYMLSALLQQNAGYKSLLMAAEQDKLTGYMKALSLSKASLPAVIFFDKEGKELNRVVTLKPTLEMKLNSISYSVI